MSFFSKLSFVFLISSSSMLYARRPHALGISYLPMNSSTESCNEYVSQSHPPPIDRNPRPIRLSPRPLDRQIRLTHQRLAHIIKTMINVILLSSEQIIVSLRSGIVVYASFEREQESADVVEAVQLVEDGDVVDFADGAFFRRSRV
jgi:hypothetical protein